MGRIEGFYIWFDFAGEYSSRALGGSHARAGVGSCAGYTRPSSCLSMALARAACCSALRWPLSFRSHKKVSFWHLAISTCAVPISASAWPILTSESVFSTFFRSPAEMPPRFPPPTPRLGSIEPPPAPTVLLSSPPPGSP